MSSTGHKPFRGLSAVALMMCLATPAFAQVGPVETAPDEPQQAAAQKPAVAPQTVQSTDRVVVTARRVEEDVQDVPIPVSVLSE